MERQRIKKVMMEAADGYSVSEETINIVSDGMKAAIRYWGRHLIVLTICENIDDTAREICEELRAKEPSTKPHI